MNTVCVETSVLCSGAGTITLEEASSHHLRDVLRVSEGDEILLVDGQGHRKPAVVLAAARGRPVLCVVQDAVEKVPFPGVPITLFQCIAKPSRMDWLVEKAAELGVARLVPIVSARSVVRPKKGEKSLRWQRIALSALCQSSSGWMMGVDDPKTWREAMEEMTRFQGPLLIGALVGETEGIATRLLQEKAAGRGCDGVGWIIGPEGDFTSEELTEAIERAHAHPVSLGPNVLRVETAALAAVSVTQAILG